MGVFATLVMCVPFISFAQTQDDGTFAIEEIKKFRVVLELQKDASVRVEESIDYDFDPNERHGIFRFIPVSYRSASGDKKNIRVRDVRISDENGNVYPYTTSYSDKNIKFKIGDPNVLIRGMHTYIISYTVSHAIGYFDTFDELYWNVTGNEWEVPILNTEAKLVLPADIVDTDVQIACYEGLYGSTERCDGVLGHSEGKTEVVFKPRRGYSVKEGMTIAVGFPKGIVYQATRFENMLVFVQDNAVVFLPFATLLIMWFLWWRRGRDPKGRGTIVPQYDVPDGLTPLEVGTIFRERVRNSDISAEIIHLAIKGYVSIGYIEEKKLLYSKKDYELVKLRNESDLDDADKSIMQHIFANADASVRISKLKDIFVQHVGEIKKAVFAKVISGGYYKTSPEVSAVYGIFGSLAIFVGIFIVEKSFITTASFVVSGIIVFVFARLMPAKTEKGMASYEYILGLRLYLQIAEKDRLEFHNAPEKKPEIFEKLLPYAMVLGVEKAWAKEFAGVYIQQPSWYHGASLSDGAFNALVMTNMLGDFRSYSNHTLTGSSSSGSGGGGFSGGGGGGGGGGSW